MFYYPSRKRNGEIAMNSKVLDILNLAATGARSKFWGVVRVEDRGGGDNSIQFINFGRVVDKSFKERRKNRGWEGG